jgi:hypothetical protein
MNRRVKKTYGKAYESSLRPRTRKESRMSEYEQSRSETESLRSKKKASKKPKKKNAGKGMGSSKRKKGKTKSVTESHMELEDEEKEWNVEGRIKQFRKVRKYELYGMKKEKVGNEKQSGKGWVNPTSELSFGRNDDKLEVKLNKKIDLLKKVDIFYPEEFFAYGLSHTNTTKFIQMKDELAHPLSAKIIKRNENIVNYDNLTGRFFKFFNTETRKVQNLYFHSSKSVNKKIVFQFKNIEDKGINRLTFRTDRNPAE